jgi:hypothetical protein
VALISSITSTNLRKIVFTPTHERLRGGFLSENPCWPHFDDIVCELVDKLCLLGYKSTLEVELWTRKPIEFSGGQDMREFLPKFREKGRVRFWEATGVELFPT